MKLTAGYIPLWRDDIDRFFSGAPQELIIFIYLLSNAHYGPPIAKWFHGKERFECQIGAGDVCTSKVELSKFSGLSRNTIKAVIARLETKNLITVIFDSPALLIRINNYSYFSYVGKPSKRPRYDEGGAQTGAGGVLKPEQGGAQTGAGGVLPFDTTLKKNDRVEVKREHNVINKNKKKNISKNDEYIAHAPARARVSKDLRPKPMDIGIDKDIRHWPADDPLGKVFTNLTKLSICKARFEVAGYRKWLNGLMERYSLTITELEMEADDWQIWHNDKVTKPSSPKGSFNTWIKNYCERRSRNGNPRKPQPTVIDDNPNKWANVNSDRPW